MTEHILATWLLTYAAHGALLAALAAVAERTGWGALPSRRDAFWKLARSTNYADLARLLHM